MKSTFEMFYNHADETWDVVKRPGDICVFSSALESDAADWLDDHTPATSA